MSRESTTAFHRQWHILMYLSEGAFVSTANIRDYLARQGIEAEMRTLQRDLRLLEQVVSLECRRDCMPHGWRWRQGRRVEGLNLAQALTLRLVEDQLHDVLPLTLLEELRPLFAKARQVTGQETEEAIRRGLAEQLASDKSGHTGPSSRRHGVVPESPMAVIVRGLRSLLAGLKPNVGDSATERRHTDAVLQALIAALRENGLEEPAGRL